MICLQERLREMARPLLLEQLEKDYPEKEKRKSGPKKSVKPIPLAAAFLTPFVHGVIFPHLLKV